MDHAPQRLYGEMVQEHGEYRALYAGVSDMWEAYEKWLATRLPQITLRPAATPVRLEAVLDPARARPRDPLQPASPIY